MDKKPEKLVPEVRFKGFTDDWEHRKLGENTMLITKGTTPYNKSNKGPINFIKVENIKNNTISPSMHITEIENDSHLSRSKLKENDILFSIAGTLGRTAIVTSNILPANTNQALAIIRGYNFNQQFLINYLSGRAVKNFIRQNPTIGAQPNLSLKQIKSFTITVPNNDYEQIKIGSLIKKLNNLVTLQQRKLEQLKQLKKAMLQQLFVDKNNKQPTLRFKNFKGDWKQHRLGEISTKVTTKNQSNAPLPVFTNSAKDGIVNQEKFFDKQIANNTSNYYVVNNNDFVYNPRISKNAPFGPIRRNTLNKTGIMSPLYYIFSLSHNTDENFLSFYFLSSKWYKFMYENGDSGARSDRFAIKDKVFQQMPIKLPLIIEQTEIGKFLNYVNILISLQQTKLTQLTTLKKYLLQKMFI